MGSQGEVSESMPYSKLTDCWESPDAATLTSKLTAIKRFKPSSFSFSYFESRFLRISLIVHDEQRDSQNGYSLDWAS